MDYQKNQSRSRLPFGIQNMAILGVFLEIGIYIIHIGSAVCKITCTSYVLVTNGISNKITDCLFTNYSDMEKMKASGEYRRVKYGPLKSAKKTDTKYR